MALSDVKARVKVTLLTVTGIGQVHTRTLHLKSLKSITEDLVSASKINAWFISRESSVLADLDANRAQAEQKDQLVIRGVYAYQRTPDSEAAFDALVDAILDALDDDSKPVNAGGTLLNATIKTSEPPALRRMDFVALGTEPEVLCHYAEIVLPVVWRDNV